MARANYWGGRAAEGAGDYGEMGAFFGAAARHPTAYYGHRAGARLGLDKIELRAPPLPDPCRGIAFMDELARAANMLYAIGERDQVVSFVADLGEQSADAGTLAALGELTAQPRDARAMLQVGKAALARGLALELYAFPDIGIPQHSPIGPAVDRSVIYSVARTESAFDQRDRSAAQAVLLVQGPAPARRDARKPS